jgi:hypothetical protein
MTQHPTTFGPFTISFEPATVSGCNYIGQTISGLQAVVRKNGVEVFRSQPHTKKVLPRQQAIQFIERAGA